MLPRFDVELVSVTKRYGETLAVDRISLRIPRSSYCCLLGPQRLRQDVDLAHDRRTRIDHRGRYPDR